MLSGLHVLTSHQYQPSVYPRLPGASSEAEQSRQMSADTFFRLHLVLKRRVDASHSLSFHANQAPEKVFTY